MEVPVIENVLKLNDEVAQMNRDDLRKAGVASVNLMGAPGTGKTALLERTLEVLKGEMRVAVLVGDLTTTRDAERLIQQCDLVRQINTGKGCHLNANQIRQGLASLPIDQLDLLIIENVGNLICPAGMDVGQDAKVGMFSVTEGDDKPAKHPYIVLESQLLLLNKIDLQPYVPFDRDRFVTDVHSVREDVPIIDVSAQTGVGVEEWGTWLRSLVNNKPKN